MPELTGGCLCGAIRYRLTAQPVTCRICWCRDCQRISSNGTVNAIFPTASIEISGTPGEYTSAGESGNLVSRRFCASCGSHLFADSTGRAGLIVVRVGTLDAPSAITPSANIWTSSAPDWACMDATLPKIEKQPQSASPPTAA
jgi:hypothetical protein